MFHKPNWNNSDKNGDSGWCKKCNKYNYVTQQEYEWIKFSVCEKWLHEKCTIFSQTRIDFGHNNRCKNLEKREKSTKT
jgi:hypothetical protein